MIVIVVELRVLIMTGMTLAVFRTDGNIPIEKEIL